MKKILIFIAIFCIFIFITEESTQPPNSIKLEKTPEQIEMSKKEEAAFQMDVLKVRALRESMKNPASFELVSALRIDGTSVLCVTYRGTNSFNAITTEHQAISRDLKFINWSKNCAGKSGEDMKRIKHGL